MGGPGLAGMSVPLVEPRTAGWRSKRAAAARPGYPAGYISAAGGQRIPLGARCLPVRAVALRCRCLR